MIVRFAFCFILMLSLFCATVSAEELWYEAYENGIKAMEAGDFATAESKLLIAKKSGKKQGKKVRAYGTRFITYIPDYYLGLVYAFQGRTEQANQHFAAAKTEKLIAQGDAEWNRMEAALRGEGAPVAQAAPTGRKAEPDLKQEAKLLVQNAQMALNRGNLAEAKTYLEKAKEKDPNNADISGLNAQILKREKIDATVTAATIAINQGQLAEGRRSLQNLMELDATNAKIPELNSALAKEEANIRAIADRATTLPEVKSAAKRIKDLQSKDPGNRLYADLLSRLSNSEATLLAKENEQIRTQKLAEFADLMTRANQSMAAKNWAQARDLASKAQATGVDDKKQAAELLKNMSTAEYQDLIFKANQAFGTNLELARELADKAAKTGADTTGQARNLLNRIDIKEAESTFEQAKVAKNVQLAQQAYNTISLKDRTHPKLKSISDWISQSVTSLTADQKEQLALLSFYQGNYGNAQNLLSQLQSQKKSARVYFYLGCTNAALAFMKSKEQREQLLKKAGELFVQVRTVDPKFKHDDRFISPRILKVYEQSILKKS